MLFKWNKKHIKLWIKLFNIFFFNSKKIKILIFNYIHLLKIKNEKIYFVNKIVFIIFTNSQQTEQIYTITYEEVLLKGGKTKIISYKENGINYYMIYNYDSKNNFHKYSSSGERINIFEDLKNNNANYTDITYLDNKKLFVISRGNHFIFNGTNCEKIYNNDNTIFLSSISHFKDSSIIIMNNKKELNSYPEIFFIIIKSI